MHVLDPGSMRSILAKLLADCTYTSIAYTYCQLRKLRYRAISNSDDMKL
jgi:hypothetical protein